MHQRTCNYSLLTTVGSKKLNGNGGNCVQGTKNYKKLRTVSTWVNVVLKKTEPTRFQSYVENYPFVCLAELVLKL